MLYTRLVRPVLFRMDPERVHNAFLLAGRAVGKPGPRQAMGLALGYSHRSLRTSSLGMEFRNPLGLAAGFDKNGLITGAIQAVGFGFMEIGSVTGEPWKGNPSPRLFRLPKDKSLAVNYGLANEGSERIAKRFAGRKPGFPVGISVAGVSRDRTVEGGIRDYMKAFGTLHHLADYTTINVSCPNLREGMTFCHPDNLSKLLKEISKLEISRPLLLKLKPDFHGSEFRETLSVIRRHRFISGLVLGNLSKDRDALRLKTPAREVERVKGGLSGQPLKEMSTELVREAYKKTRRKLVIVGCGGVFTAEDAYEKILAGASLVQMVTGMIYGGPASIGSINRGLAKLLGRDGYRSVDEAVGQG